MKNPKLSSDQAYSAAKAFLEKELEEFGWTELGPLLGSMCLIDGVPLDQALMKDWDNVFVKEYENSRLRDTSEGLDKYQAYAAIFSFFKNLFVLERTDLSALIKDMSLIDCKPKDPKFARLWKEAVSFAKAGGQADSMKLTKDGVIFDVHKAQ